MYLCRRFERPASDAGIIDEETGIQCRGKEERTPAFNAGTMNKVKKDEDTSRKTKNKRKKEHIYI